MASGRWIAVTRARCLILVAGTCAAGRAGETETPDCFRPRTTWWETMLASHETLAEQEAEAECRADPLLRAFLPLRMRLARLARRIGERSSQQTRRARQQVR